MMRAGPVIKTLKNKMLKTIPKLEKTHLPKHQGLGLESRNTGTQGSLSLGLSVGQVSSCMSPLGPRAMRRPRRNGGGGGSRRMWIPESWLRPWGPWKYLAGRGRSLLCRQGSGLGLKALSVSSIDCFIPGWCAVWEVVEALGGCSWTKSAPDSYSLCWSFLCSLLTVLQGAKLFFTTGSHHQDVLPYTQSRAEPTAKNSSAL